MMKYFVCLANSRKYSERCIAGIELAFNNPGYRILWMNGKPCWIRPGICSIKQGRLALGDPPHVPRVRVYFGLTVLR